MEDLLKQIDTERDTRFEHPWAKLDKGTRLNRITLFTKSEKRERGLSDEEERKLRILLTQLCETGSLKKTSEVDYEEGTIKNIKSLVFNEDTRLYAYLKEEKKGKPVHKSKGNIERHFSKKGKSKENKR